jgi:hypothetical protein
MRSARSEARRYGLVMQHALGIVAVTFGPLDVEAAAARAVELDFDHLDASAAALDALSDEERAALPLPIGEQLSGFEVRDGCTANAPARPRDEAGFNELVAVFRAHPGARFEPGPGTAVSRVERIEALIAAVPGLRLTVDTGHVATWGEDPVPLLRHADHVQLRQAAHRRPQLHPDEGGDVDFAAVFAELERLDYPGLLSIEYFDLPDMGLPLDDPVGHAVALRDQVRPLLP